MREGRRVESQSRGLTVGEVAEMLDGVHPETVRRYLKSGMLRSRPRLPRGHRRIDKDSVIELIDVMSKPDGPKKEAELQALIDRNLGRTPIEGP
jgi:excisionase family DNA binding protein